MFNLKVARRLGVEGRYDDLLKPLLRGWNIVKLKLRNNPKIVVIGFNKTGTTSVYHALDELGYKMSNQHDFERLFKKYKEGDIKIEEIFRKCALYEAFQDIPFSLPEFYKLMSERFPKGKFILTIRNSGDVWFNSFNKYYGGVESLKKRPYIEKGFLYTVFKDAYNSEDLTKEDCIEAYENHLNEVKTYFENKDNQLLVIDVAKEESYSELCRFLGKKPMRQSFQWKNKTIL